MDIFIQIRSVITTFGGSVRFNRPPVVDQAKGTRLLDAFVGEGRTPFVHLDGDALGDRIRSVDELSHIDGQLVYSIHGILKRCLVPENVRICIGDVLRVDRAEEEFFGVVTDTCGLVQKVDGNGALITDIPFIVIFGEDDFEVVGHEEFARGILDLDPPEETYGRLRDMLAAGQRPTPVHKRFRAFEGATALERTTGRTKASDWGIPEGTPAAVIGYDGIEALVYKGSDGAWKAHPDYAWKDPEGIVRIGNA